MRRVALNRFAFKWPGGPDLNSRRRRHLNSGSAAFKSLPAALLLCVTPLCAQIDWGAVASLRVGTDEVAALDLPGLGRVWERPAPLPYDEVVEYIEATGTQYIDTGLVVTPTLRMAIDMAVTDWDASTYSLTGAGGIRFAFGKGYSGASTGTGNAGKLYFGIGAQNLATSTALSGLKNVRHTYGVDASTAKAWMDNASWNLSSAGTISTGTLPILLLAQSMAADPGYRGNQAARLYGATFTDNGVLVRDFIPVRAGTEYCLYDRVSGALFRNAGSGAFLGPAP